MKILIGILIPFIGTSLGASFVFLMKKGLNKKLEKFILGFASGVMIAASFWSLIIPALNICEKQNVISWVPVSIGFLLGILLMILLDKLAPQNDFENSKIKVNNKKINKTMMLFLAVTIHNIPEGMAVGVSFAGLLTNNNLITLASCYTLAIGIGLQNIPEGLIISAPFKVLGKSKCKSFLYGVISGVVEPIFAFLTLLLAKKVSILLPYFLSLAAGVMLYVVSTELIPESNDKKSYLGQIGLSLGFIIMMILDVSLG